MTRRELLVGAAAVAACRRTPAPVELPNVLVVMCDQLRASALSAYGDPNIRTPHMDGLLTGGAFMETALVSNPLCSPARASLLTGMYPGAVGVPTNDRQLSSGVSTIGTVFGAAGYHTGWIGKWHLARNDTGPPEDPAGFVDHYQGYNERYHYRASHFYGLHARGQQKPQPANTFEPTYQTTQALELMERWVDVPFAMFLSYTPPHPPRDWRGDWDKHFPDAFPYGVDPDALTLRPNVPAEAERAHGDPANPLPGARRFLRNYYGAILSLEPELARLTRGLSRLGLDDRTLVVFTSDHGDLGGSHGKYLKQKPYEESVHVPLGFRWTGRIPKRTHAFPISNVDVLPTLAGLAGVAMPHEVHGRDLSAALLGGEAPQTPVLSGCHLTNRDKRWWQIRDARWSYTAYDGAKQPLLFDMVEDPYQLRNLAAEPAVRDTVQRLDAELRTRRAAIGA